MNACPECGQRQWRYEGNVWTCARGHHHDRTVGEPAPARRQLPGWVTPSLIATTIAVATELLIR